MENAWSQSDSSQDESPAVDSLPNVPLASSSSVSERTRSKVKVLDISQAQISLKTSPSNQHMTPINLELSDHEVDSPLNELNMFLEVSEPLPFDLSSPLIDIESNNKQTQKKRTPISSKPYYRMRSSLTSPKLKTMLSELFPGCRLAIPHAGGGC